MERLFKLMFFILLFVSVIVITGWISEAQTSKALRAQVVAAEDEFQIYRSAAEDAFGWALGSDSEYGEKIPAEFFWQYDGQEKTEEEAALLYFQADLS